jgi:two-component system cell cycle sensor histidine kinase/response regulator CckA
MIKDTFPKSIVLSVKAPEKGLWLVQGDTTELHQVLLNLCVNARDALPQGGRLTLSAQNLMLDAQKAAATDAKPGPYVMISVADTGTGIPPEVLPRIFEPFFTTKTRESGTGLGLSTVAGIVKHHGGFMGIETGLGEGTEFKVYFPAADSAETAEAESIETALPPGQGELILVVEDEETLLELTKITLESCGYRVVTAQNGLTGIARFKEELHEIKLLITDSDMPFMNGMGAIHAIRELKPDIPVILASGYNQGAEELQKIDLLHLQNLGKPYSLDQLRLAVDTALRH